MGFIDGFKSGLGLGAPSKIPFGGDLTVKSGFTDAISGTSASLTLFDTSTGALRRGSEELLAAYRSNPHVRKVASLIANQLASVEFYLEKATKRGASKALRPRAKAIAQNSDRVDEHPFLDFLYGGNPVMPGSSGLKLCYLYYLLKGECFILLMPNPDGSLGWMAIPPHWVNNTPGGGEGGSYTLNWGAKVLRVPAEAMLWVRDPDVVNPYGRGSGVGDSLRDEVDTDEYAATLMRVTLANKGLMDGILQVEHADRDSLQAMRLDFERNHRGTFNSGKVMVIDGSSVKYIPLSQAFSELKLLELRAAEKTIIEETFCVPPELFGKVSNSNRATIFHAQKIFADNVLVPILETFTLEISLRLLPLFDPKGTLYLSYESPSPSDKERRLELMKIFPESYTVNEIRRESGLPDEPWGNVRYVQAQKIEVPALSGGGKRRALRRSKKKALSEKASTAAIGISDAQREAILALYTPEKLAKKLGPQWRDRMEDIAADELEKLGASASFQQVNPLIEDHIDTFGLDRLSVPIGTSRELAAAAITNGINNFESIQEIANRLVAVGVTDQGFRARLIARTEVVRSSNVARDISWKASKVPGLKKRWLSALLESSRDSHKALHNQVINLNDSFSFDASLSPFIGGILSVPGDIGVAAHACNCACTSTAFLPEVGKAIEFGSEEHVMAMKAFDEQRAPWEAEATKTIEEFYKDIETQTLKILGVRKEDLE